MYPYLLSNLSKSYAYEIKAFSTPLFSGSTPSFPVRKRDVLAALTPEVKTECLDLVSTLHAIPSRDQRSKVFEEKFKNVTPDTYILIDHMIRKEDTHKVFVNSLLQQLPDFFGRKPHDFSKDALFCFVMSFRFDCGIDTKEMLSLSADEFLNHYRQESHHPEWETQHNEECSPIDILEMAIDRLSRNLQRNDGILDMAQMIQYLPRFPLGDNAGKQSLYLKYVEEYKAMVQNVYVPRE